MNSSKSKSSEFLVKLLFALIALSCLHPLINPPVALFLGLLFAQFMGNPFHRHTQKVTSWLLKAAIVVLGFGINIIEAIEAGKIGFSLTMTSILLTLGFGIWLGKKLGVSYKTNLLIASGTAICGGSAIAAVSPIIKANPQQISVALVTVFTLNSIALFLFPTVGHWLDLNQNQFGYWAAIAIHDTSSVVGAASSFGEEALKIATTVKLQRALWIIPLSIGIAFWERSKRKTKSPNDNLKIKFPWFILLFVLAMVANTYLPKIAEYKDSFVFVGKRTMTLTLFLIGSNLSLSALKIVGWRPMITGIILWILISVSSLFFISKFL